MLRHKFLAFFLFGLLAHVRFVGLSVFFFYLLVPLYLLPFAFLYFLSCFVLVSILLCVCVRPEKRLQVFGSIRCSSVGAISRIASVPLRKKNTGSASK